MNTRRTRSQKEKSIKYLVEEVNEKEVLQAINDSSRKRDFSKQLGDYVVY